MDNPSPEHVNQVAEIAEIVKTAFMLAHQCGATGGACCDAALSSFIAIVSAFGQEQATIDALPYIREVLEQRMQERMLREADEHEKHRLAETAGGTVH